MNLPDHELVKRWRGGDLGAFEALMRQHFGSVWAVALSILQDRDEAEDVCQKTWVRCWDRRDQCRHPERFRGWLLAITRSVAHNHLKRLKSRRSDSLDHDLVGSEISPARSAEIAELREQLHTALATLSEVQRTVLLLRDLEGSSHADIAEQLGISETMSRRHASDARKLMRGSLLEMGMHDDTSG